MPVAPAPRLFDIFRSAGDLCEKFAAPFPFSFNENGEGNFKFSVSRSDPHRAGNSDDSAYNPLA